LPSSFPTEFWQLVHFSLLYIFGTADHKFVSVAGRFLAPFADCWRILLLGSPNPLRSGLAVQSTRAFEVFVPMLRYVNHADLQLFSLSLGVPQNLLYLSDEMQRMFQAISSFHLIAGFFQRIDVVHFHLNICSALFALFASFSSCALRS
jgi:hypothetical protein